jgi:hypothetical protein
VLSIIVIIMKITGGGIYAVLTVILIISGRSIFSVNSYCENNGEVNVQC